MPKRRIVLATGEFYHIINRGVTSQPIFTGVKNYQRALNTLFFYKYNNLPFKYSRFLIKSKKEKGEILEKLNREKNFLIEVVAYCLMPNHFHFLLRQKADEGITKFMGNFTNSYVRYFNLKNERKGPLFESKFKAVRIETEEQLLHVSRYIHLNPYSAYLIKNFKDLKNYPYSSLSEYLKKTNSSSCQKEIVLNYFKNKDQYKKFVFNQADYQRKLEMFKHLFLEKLV